MRMGVSGSPRRTIDVASTSISSKIPPTVSKSSAEIRTNRVRTLWNDTGARRKPTADPTPAFAGITTSSMPSFSASCAAWSGALPPSATSVRSNNSRPRSVACRRAAFAMFSSTVSLIANADCSWLSSSGPPIDRRIASRLASSLRRIRPPAKCFGSMRPSTRFASVTVALDPPRS